MICSLLRIEIKGKGMKIKGKFFVVSLKEYEYEWEYDTETQNSGYESTPEIHRCVSGEFENQQLHAWLNRLHHWARLQKIYFLLHMPLFIPSLQQVFIINPPLPGFQTPAIRERFLKLFDVTSVWKVFS